MTSEYDMLEWDEHLKHVNRYRLTEEQWRFVGTALEYISASVHEISAAQDLHRARKHAIHQTDAYPLAGMGAPPAHLHKGGRCTPCGIPCLYLASDPETAISEVRPWKGALVSVARFSFRRALRLADLQGIAHRRDFQAAGGAGQSEEAMSGRVATLLLLERSFSRPGHEESEVEYAPTQFVASIFKAEGFDGLVYSSLMRATGFNVALFDPDLAVAQAVDMYEVEDVNYWPRKVDHSEGAGGSA